VQAALSKNRARWRECESRMVESPRMRPQYTVSRCIDRTYHASMGDIDRQRAGPWWQPSGIDLGRRRALVGLSGLVVAAMGSTPAWAQAPRSCVLTPEAGEGPFYLDPNLLRSDITSGQPGAPLHLALQVVRAAD